ncbi:MAG TPA: DUF488 family protein [Acidimicrobiales bacterium]|nr:DUF488 family protein [Acidimicrobiales bacterium]
MSYAASIIRVYDDDASPPKTGYKVLVDRLWPRGVKKESLSLDDWAKDVTPSPDLRKWYGHDPDRFERFREKYRTELGNEPAAAALDELATKLRSRPVVLYTAVKDVDISAATVLAEILNGDTPLD